MGKPDLAMGLGGGHVAFVALEGDRRHLNGWHLSPNLSFIPSELEVCVCGRLEVAVRKMSCKMHFKRGFTAVQNYASV